MTNPTGYRQGLKQQIKRFRKKGQIKQMVYPVADDFSIGSQSYSKSWISRASGWQTERADCNHLKKITFLENYFNKDKSVRL